MRPLLAAAWLMICGCGREHSSFGDEIDNPAPAHAPDQGVTNPPPPLATNAPVPPVAPSPSDPPPFVSPVECGPGSCPIGSYCDYPESANCGKDNRIAKCRQPAVGCDMKATPVCGCDGVTYLNACQASAASVALRFESVGCDVLDADAGMR
jgi:Kazal-type serine protease inhibitor domain